MRNVKREEILTGLTCPKCQQGELAIKFGRNGEFLACTRYSKDGGPDSCDFTSNFHRDGDGQIVLDAASAPETSDVMCDVCGRPMVLKKSRFGPFLGCSGYPECTNTRRIGKDGKPVPLPVPTGVTCPKCHQGELMQRRGKFGRPFYGCNRYPKCDYLTNDLASVANYVPGQEAPSTQPAAAPKARRAAAAASTAATTAKPAARSGTNGRGAAKTSTRATPTRAASAGKSGKRSTAAKPTASKPRTKRPAAAGDAPAPKPASRSRSRVMSELDE
jgi:DNA topoisomerase-1